MNNDKIESVIEAILFASGEAISAERISLVLGIDKEAVFGSAKKLADEYSFAQRGIRLVRTEDRLQLVSAPEHSDEVLRVLERRRPPKLSQTALEVLAICAYFQPVTRAYVEQVRGVDSSYTVGILLDRGLLESCGKLEAPGRPTLYRTTDVFLRMLGITNLSELPLLPDLTNQDGVARLNEAIEAMKMQESEQLTIEELQN